MGAWAEELFGTDIAADWAMGFDRPVAIFGHLVRQGRAASMLPFPRERVFKDWWNLTESRTP